MTGLTQEFLQDIGIQMDDGHFQLFSEHFDETLYKRIEDDVIYSLDQTQIHELTQLRDSGSDTVWQWLQTNVPNLNEIIQKEVDAMLTEVVQSSDNL